MTPSERAQWLIKEMGHEKAEAHATWVWREAVKQTTKDYWNEVGNEIRKSLYAAYDATLNRTCKSCMTPIPEGSGYCKDCKPISHGKE